MNTPEYKILAGLSVDEVQRLVNQAIQEIGKEVTLLGGMVAEIYQGFPPTYYQTVLITNKFSEALLMENFGIGIDYKRELQLLHEDKEKSTPSASDPYPLEVLTEPIKEGVITTIIPDHLKKSKKKKDVPKVIHESNQRTPNSWDL